MLLAAYRRFEVNVRDKRKTSLKKKRGPAGMGRLKYKEKANTSNLKTYANSFYK